MKKLQINIPKPQPDYLNLTAAEAIELEDMERRGVGFKRSASAPEPPAKPKEQP